MPTSFYLKGMPVGAGRSRRSIRNGAPAPREPFPSDSHHRTSPWSYVFVMVLLSWFSVPVVAQISPGALSRPHQSSGFRVALTSAPENKTPTYTGSSNTEQAPLRATTI